MKKGFARNFVMHRTTHEETEFEAVAVKVSLVSVIGNIVLSIFKLIAGIVASSGAMVSDAVHSASDVFSSIVVIVGVKLAAQASDKKHPYGHERFECVVAVVLAVILFVCGLFIGYTAIEKIGTGEAEQSTVPGVLALVAAIVSIAVKEAMYWYTRFYALRWDSPSLMADAWHHRSDAFSSVGALIGVIGARMGFPALDTVASLIICLFIVKAAYAIFKDAMAKMVDCYCGDDMEEKILSFVSEQDGVVAVSSIRTRVFGNRIYVDIIICADGNITLAESHVIAKQVHDSIEKKFEKIKHITVCVNPV